jgi:hypothetical protein
MAAGAIPPANAFRYAFENGADHVLAGMFDFEIAQDAQIANGILDAVTRSRPCVLLQTEMDKSFETGNLFWTVMKGICYGKAAQAV